MKYILVILTIYLIAFKNECLCKTDQCPDIFEFHKNGSESYGIITIPPPGEGRTVMEIEIELNGTHNGAPTSLRLEKPLIDAIKDAERGKDIQYLYRFPQGRELPTIRRITLNEEDICRGPKDSNLFASWNKHEIINPENATQFSHIPFRQRKPPKLVDEPSSVKGFSFIGNSLDSRRPSSTFAPAPEPKLKPTTRPPPKSFTPRSTPWIWSFYPRTSSTPQPPLSLKSTSPRPVPTPSSPLWTISPHTTSQPPPWLFTPRTVPTPQPTPSSESTSPFIVPTQEHFPTPIARPNDSSWLGSMPFAGTCGRNLRPKRMLQVTQLIIGGNETRLGEFPWLVALFHYKGRIVQAVCGASLISNNYVITAAHCTRNQKRVFLEIGKYDISDPFEEDYISRNSMNIIENTEYVEGGAHGDVALIEIEPVEFTQMIQPICLWAQGRSLDNEVQEGTVSGWGQIENDGPSSTIPMKLNVRTANLDKCREDHRLLRDIATDKTFCAGGEGNGPCHGDSGSGFYMKHDGVWYLRGVISTSLGGVTTCNLERYAVYVDLTYFLDWMRPYLSP